MKHGKRMMLATGSLLAGALWLLSSRHPTSAAWLAANDPSGRYGTSLPRSLQSGTPIFVALGNNISSESARIGDSWHGTVTEDVAADNGGRIPPGSEVDGVVEGVTPATPGSCAMLELGFRSIRVNGYDESIAASSASVIAGSAGARRLGAILCEAIPGAQIAAVVSGRENGATGATGVIVGSAPESDAVAGPKLYQLVLADGTVMRFTVSRTVAMQ